MTIPAKIKVRDWFELDPDAQRRVRLLTELQPCPNCKGTGECSFCSGSGEIVHECECDCEYCEITDHVCDDCDGFGECEYCDGSGERLLTERELKHAGVYA